MKNQRYTFAFWIILGASLASGVYAKDTAPQVRENKIKAAFLYNFLKFIDWPQDKVIDSNDKMVLSVIGKNIFGNSFDAISKKNVNGKELVIKHFPDYKQLTSAQKDQICNSHLLFISNSEQPHLKDILNLVNDKSVLTVADMKQFLENGGHINFIVREKVNFEINLSTAKKAGLKLRAQLLKVAYRVINDKELKKNQSLVADTPNLIGKHN